MSSLTLLYKEIKDMTATLATDLASSVNSILLILIDINPDNSELKIEFIASSVTSGHAKHTNLLVKRLSIVFLPAPGY